MDLKTLLNKRLLTGFTVSLLLFITGPVLYGQTVTDVENDTIRLCVGTTVLIDLLANDTDADPGEILETEILVDPESILIEYDDEDLPEGTYEIIIDSAFFGTDFMIYEVCGEDDLCATGILVIIVSECVWPGDGNRDSICNYVDLLPLGLYFGLTGPLREDVDGLWDEAFADEWTSPIEVDIDDNPKFSDFNGDGAINSFDTITMLTNYGELRGTYIPVANIGGADNPTISIDFLVDTITAGSNVVIPINFGTELTPASNIYGAAFEITYDKTLIKADSIQVSFNSGWFGTPGDDLIFVQNNDTINGIISIAVTRINQVARTGYNHFGELSFVMEDNIAGKTVDQITAVLTFCIGTPNVIKKSGQGVPVQIACDSAIAIQFTNSINNSNNNSLLLTYPNPADETITITLPKHLQGKCLIINELGQPIYKQEINADFFIVNSDLIPSGNYIIQFISETEVYTQQLIIQH